MALILSTEQHDLLCWLSEQPEPTSKSSMQQANAPGYDDQRIETMVRDGLLSRTITVENGDTAGAYALTDKATAILQAQERLEQQQANDLAKEKREKQQKYFWALVSYFAGIVSTVMVQLILLWIQRRLNW